MHFNCSSPKALCYPCAPSAGGVRCTMMLDDAREQQSRRSERAIEYGIKMFRSLLDLAGAYG